MGVQTASFLVSHFLFAFKYWQVSLKMSELLELVDQSMYEEQKQRCGKCFRTSFVIATIIITIIAIFFRYVSAIDKLRNNDNFSLELNVVYLFTL